MHTLRFLTLWLILIGFIATPLHAEWMVFTGGPTVATGVWPGGTALSGTAIAKQSNVVNGNLATLPIGLLPITVGPALSPAYFATSLVPNPGSLVTSLGTPYNDTGDTYHVSIDFSGTTGGPNPNVLPAGSIFAILDLDITENYRKIFATDVTNSLITTPWISAPIANFDMNNPQVVPPGPPTLAGPVGGVYGMFGIATNYDIGMWLFKTTQDVKTINFDMEVGVGGNTIGGGGATWAFYTPHGVIVPEPSAMLLIACGLALGVTTRRREGIRS
jgi:hypothetical protein